MKLAKSPKLRYRFIWAKVMRKTARQLLRIYAVKWERGDYSNLVISHSETANEVAYTFNWK